MFIGTYEHTIDAKGRVSLPARFRELLTAQQDSRLVLTTNMDPAVQCLALYPIIWWQEFTSQILSLSPFHPDVIRFKRVVIARAAEVQLDRQGRVLVPQFLRKHAGLERQVLWAGAANCIELWDVKLWDQEHEALRKDLPRIIDTLQDLSSRRPPK